MNQETKIAIGVVATAVASLSLAIEMPLWGLTLFVLTGILGIITLVIVEDRNP